MRLVAFAAGAALVSYTLLAAVKTVILPRATSPWLNRLVFRSTRWAFRIVAPERASYEHRDRVMALFGPVSMLLMPLAWVALVEVGFMLMFWGVRDEGLSDAFLISGSSLLTLGFATVDGTWQRLLAFLEATLGLGLVALLITFLPTLYNAFSRREIRVGMLEVRAGSPPSAIEYIQRHHRLDWLERMQENFAEWEVWFVELEEVHTSYPALNFFRSPEPDRSWVTAAGTILDAASLTASTLDLPPHPHVNLSIRAGFLALRRIADFFGVAYDVDPKPDDPISITRYEFDEAYDALAESGVPLRPDREQAWRDFAGWRVNYDTVLLALAELTMAPLAPWTSDRSTPAHRPVRLRRWSLGRNGAGANLS